MGEYIKLANGEDIKIGTCENLYYVTYQQLKNYITRGAKKLEGNLEPRDYLKEENGFRYRFPFPKALGLNEFDDGYRFTINLSEYPEFITNVSHYPKCQAIDREMTLLLKQQKLVSGVLIPILECESCRVKFRVEDYATVKSISLSIMEQEPNREVANEIVDSLLNPFEEARNGQ